MTVGPDRKPLTDLEKLELQMMALFAVLFLSSGVLIYFIYLTHQ
jgi:hypothetical protein